MTLFKFLKRGAIAWIVPCMVVADSNGRTRYPHAPTKIWLVHEDVNQPQIISGSELTGNYSLLIIRQMCTE